MELALRKCLSQPDVRWLQRVKYQHRILIEHRGAQGSWVARDRGGSFRLAMKTEWNVMLGSCRSTEKERSRAVEEWYRGSM